MRANGRLAGAREGRGGADDDIYDAVRHAHADRASMQRRAQTVALRRVTLRRVVDRISNPSLDLPPSTSGQSISTPRQRISRADHPPEAGGCMGTKTNKPCPPHHCSRRSRSPPCMHGARRPLEEAQGPVGPCPTRAGRIRSIASHGLSGSPACYPYPSSPRVPTPERSSADAREVLGFMGWPN